MARVIEPSSDEWGDWAGEATQHEKALAQALEDAEVGDYIHVDHPEDEREASVEIKYIDREGGVTELRCEKNLIWWVVRGKYVFCTTRDFDPIFVNLIGMGKLDGGPKLLKQPRG